MVIDLFNAGQGWTEQGGNYMESFSMSAVLILVLLVH